MTRPLRCLAALLATVLVAPLTVSAARGGGHGPRPVVSSVTPDSAPLEGSVQLSIHGDGFLCGLTQPASSTRVLVGRVAVGIGSVSRAGAPLMPLVSDTEILVTAPAAAAAGTVDILVSVPCGVSAASAGARLTYQGECTGTCSVSVDATAADGPAIGRASGILHGDWGGWSGTQDPASAYYAYVKDIGDLDIQQWRIADTPWEQQLYDALPTKPVLTYVLSDAFATATGGEVPWSNGFRDWNDYTRAMMTGQSYCNPALCSGCPSARCVPPPEYDTARHRSAVTYWDVFNEPTTYNTFAGASPQTQFFQLIADTTVVVRAVDPAARVVAPSVVSMLDWSLPQSGPMSAQNDLSMKDMLDWLTSYNLTHTPVYPDAYSFHYLQNHATCSQQPAPYPGCSEYPQDQPMLAADEVNRVRNLLAQYPDLATRGGAGRAEIHVNEFSHGGYSTTSQCNCDQLIPGEMAGYIAAFESSNVDRADISCWMEVGMPLSTPAWDQCQKGFDGLLDDSNDPLNPNLPLDDVLPQAIYWVFQFYGTLTGQTRVRTATQNTDITVFATRDAAAGTVSALVGRARACSISAGGIPGDPPCPAGGPAVTVDVQVRVPSAWQSVGYTLQQIQDVNGGHGGRLVRLPACPASPVPAPAPAGGALPACAAPGSNLPGNINTLPSPVTGVAPVRDGVATVAIPGFADGDADTLILTGPASPPAAGSSHQPWRSS